MMLFQGGNQRQRPPPTPLLPSSPLITTVLSRISLFSLLLLFFLLAAAAAPAAAQTPSASDQLNNATDLAALRAFISRADPNAGLSPSWDVDADFCSHWRGVACGPRRQRVTQLSLPGASLAGEIPPQIGNLSFLVSLNLSGNRLKGPLPGAALARLRRLRFLDLSSNSLTGPFPAELGDLPNMHSLILGDNQFEGRIPPAFGRISTLRVLQLNKNRGINGAIPAEIGNLSQIWTLGLGDTNLTGTIPPALGNLTELRYLMLQDTLIDGEIPADLGKLAKLKELNLGANYLEGGFPAAVYNMSSLEELVLALNERLTGTLPGDFGRRLPPSIRDLYINENAFFGTIPSSLSNASMLSTLELSYNSFVGSVPGELGALQQLTQINVADNNLTGPLHFLGALTSCRKLQQLNLLDNGFTGSLPPAAVANFTNTDLTLFVGQGNRLTGSLPAAFGNLTKLYTVVLSHNMLSGKIPPELTALPNLQRLYLEVNRLEGPIPPEIGSAGHLGLIYLQVNNLSGAIPQSIGNLTALRELNLAKNELDSPLPQGLWQLSGLFSLNLAQNKLEGQLPDAMSRLANLTGLDLSSNDFSGSIPSTIGGLRMLEELRLANNRLSGTLPPALGSLAGLKMLDLSSNFLSGGIPSSFDQLRSLERLNLSFNMLQGQVPTGGIFAKESPPGISDRSFLGNAALCRALLFGLPACKEAGGKSGRHKHIVIASVAAASGLLVTLLLVIFLVLARRRRKRRKEKKSKSPDPLSNEDMVDGHPLISRHELAMGTNNFDETNLLGAGSFGKVYRGRLADGSLVAVKVLDLQMGEAAWRSFDAECRVMRAVRHRNLVGIITSCSNPDFRALVLPFMANGSLERWIHPGDDEDGGPRLSLRQRVGVAADVAAALEYLHHGCSEPVVHCDLKPSNVLLDGDMVAHIGDFGIAKVLVEHSRSATSTSTPGTFGYMAPEYGTGGRVTTKGDVYSYGILLLEMFTGKRPTDRRFTGNVNLRSWVAAAFPGAVADVVDECLLQDQPEEPSSSGGGGSSIISSNSSSRSSSGRGHSAAGRARSGGAGAVSREREERQRLECIVGVLELGLMCSSQFLKERPDMVEVAAMLKKIGASLDTKNLNGSELDQMDSKCSLALLVD